jgi:hypothetical protein
MTDFSKTIGLEKGKTYLVSTKEDKLDVLRVDLAKFLARNKGVKTIYVTLHLAYDQLLGKLNNVNLKNFFFIDVTFENTDGGNVGNCVKVTNASPMNIYLEIQKVVDYYSTRNLNPPPLVILYDHFPKMKVNFDETIKLTKILLKSFSNDVSSIAVLINEKINGSEFEEIESKFDNKLMV